MQIALAESQREVGWNLVLKKIWNCSWQAEDEERRRRNDDLKVKIALERSVNESSPDANNSQVKTNEFFWCIRKQFSFLVIWFQFKFSTSWFITFRYSS
jgi:hypothetical protein